MKLDTSHVKFELGQVYHTSDQSLTKQVLKVVYLPDDSPDLMATEDETGHKKFVSREIAKRCIVLGMWKLQPKEEKQEHGVK